MKQFPMDIYITFYYNLCKNRRSPTMEGVFPHERRIHKSNNESIKSMQ